MIDRPQRMHDAFRLNLEQQKHRAKDLLQAVKAADASALARMAAIQGAAELRSSGAKLADAQFVIARELGFLNWSELKSHIASLDRARADIRDRIRAPDADMKTLHLRCGSDIRETLREAGFGGDFLEHSYPYCHGPVTATPDHFEREARFLTEFATEMNVSFADALARRRQEEGALFSSAANYERIVLWMEHDCFDQLVLVRCLAHYANTQPPRLLELINVNRFPGAVRFIGLGQLPVEAIRLLWEHRRPVTAAQLAVASDAWEALTQEDPRPLAALMRGGTAALPDLAIALHRLLRELPSMEEGLSLTERMILQILSEADATVQRVFALLTYERDPLPFATDLMLLRTIEAMLQVSALTKTSAASRWEDRLTITDLGRAVLRRELDWLSLQPRSRWVGGIQFHSNARNWRWDEIERTVVLI